MNDWDKYMDCKVKCYGKLHEIEVIIRADREIVKEMDHYTTLHIVGDYSKDNICFDMLRFQKFHKKCDNFIVKCGKVLSVIDGAKLREDVVDKFIKFKKSLSSQYLEIDDEFKLICAEYRKYNINKVEVDIKLYGGTEDEQ